VGTPVFGGMIFASLIGIFAIPPLYISFQWLREKLRPGARPQIERASPGSDTNGSETHEKMQPPRPSEAAE
jgi:hypothetical protein